MAIEPEKRTRRIKVAVDFHFPEDVGVPAYDDTLFIPIDEWASMTSEKLDTLEQERYDAHRDRVQATDAEPG